MPVDGFFGRSAKSLVRAEAVGAEPAEFLDVITLSYTGRSARAAPDVGGAVS